MKRVLRTVVLSACAAAAVAFGGIHDDGADGADGAGPATRAQQGPDLGELFRATIRGGSTQHNDCDGLFGGEATGDGSSGASSTGDLTALSGGGGGMSLAAFNSPAVPSIVPGAARGCSNIRG
ncbi:hypothetical protein ACWC5C_00165 [Streptomyces sp. NPDC001700]